MKKKDPGSGGFQGLCLLNHDLELRSSSFTFGNVSKHSFLSLNHDLVTIVYIESLRGMLHALAAEVVVNAAVSGTLLLERLDACGCA